MALRVVIIGGGAAGLACLQAVLETEEHKTGKWSVSLVEEREDIGGIWLPAEPTDDPPKTALYDGLTTNLPHPIMAFDSLPFPPETPLFPTSSVVLEYLQRYTTLNLLRPHIQLNSRVVETTWVDNHWKITISNYKSTRSIEADRLVVANGHYRVPHFPNLPGLQDWRNRGLITHSAWYRQPIMAGKVIVVVGGGPSGRDISHDHLDFAHTVVWCVRRQANEDRGHLKLRGAVTRFLGKDFIEFEDGSQYGPVDHVILATGYDLSFPFLKTIVPGLPSISPFPSHLISSKRSIFPLARFLFPLQEDFPPDSVAFLGLPAKIVPFPLVEAQARAALQVFRDPSCFSSAKEREVIRNRYISMSNAGSNSEGIAHDWNIFVGMEQFDYRDELYAFIGKRERKVGQWVKEIFKARDELRARWQEAEKVGSAEDWIKGVGYDGIEDWIRMMYKFMASPSP